VSEPRRWRDDADAPVGMRELLAASRPTRAMDDRSFRRGAARVGRLGAAPAAAAVAVGIWTKLATAGVIGIAAVGTVVAASRGSDDEPRAATAVATRHVAPAAPAVTGRVQVAEPEPAAPADPGLEAEAATAPLPSFAAARVQRAPTAAAEVPSLRDRGADQETAPAPAAAAAAREATLAAELAMLEDARAVIDRDPELALAHLDTHRRLHPEGSLAVERSLMELDALRRAGRTEEVRDRAEAWLARAPSGLHSARVRAILASLEARQE
jgi:hypothetical protein